MRHMKGNSMLMITAALMGAGMGPMGPGYPGSSTPREIPRTPTIHPNYKPKRRVYAIIKVNALAKPEHQVHMDNKVLNQMEGGFKRCFHEDKGLAQYNQHLFCKNMRRRILQKHYDEFNQGKSIKRIFQAVLKPYLREKGIANQ